MQCPKRTAADYVPSRPRHARNFDALLCSRSALVLCGDSLPPNLQMSFQLPGWNPSEGACERGGAGGGGTGESRWETRNSSRPPTAPPASTSGKSLSVWEPACLLCKLRVKIVTPQGVEEAS